MSDPRTHFSQAFFLALLVQNKPLNVLWLIFDHFFPLSRLLFPVFLWKLIRNEDQHLDDLSSVYLDRNDWLGMERHWLLFKAYQKRLSLQTPGILLLQFSFHILRKNYSRADEFVHAILLVIFDPIAITPAVVHGILTKISFPFTLHKTSLNLQHWELLLAVTVQVVWILIKLFSCLELNWVSTAIERHQDNEKHCAKFLSKLDSTFSSQLWR